jgi:nucleolar protein 14
MPPSQLKRLKVSLREQGLRGQTKSKKEKKNSTLTPEQKLRRRDALAALREDLNPFETKQLSRPAKKQFTTAETLRGPSKDKTILGRPGVSRALGEQRRRDTLLAELQKRRKVGGILDRRIGEDDDRMTAEEKNIQRFTQARSKKNVFDLEEDGDDFVLTHGGRELEEGDEDYDAASIQGSEDSHRDMRKREREESEAEDVNEDVLEEDDEPERKRSKREIMEEVMKKSKLFKYERQKAKEDDDEIRRKLDDDFSGFRSALGAFTKATEQRAEKKPEPVPEPEKPDIHPDRAALMDTTDELYDKQLKKIAKDQRAQPSDRIKTEQERAEKQAAIVKELEEKRAKRMRGELESEDEKSEPEEKEEPEGLFVDSNVDDAAEFGLKGSKADKTFVHTRPDGVDDEDDFLIEEDLIASASEGEDGDLELFSEDESEDELLADKTNKQSKAAKISCPSNLEQVKTLLLSLKEDRYHETIRNIRLQHDPALNASNKEKLANFAEALIQFLPHTTTLSTSSIDVIIRHIHSMARKAPEPVSHAFRAYLKKMHETKSMTPSDLVVLTAIGSVFPPSDHFHSIITPSLLLIARWLGLTDPKSEVDLSTGAYLIALVLKYQSLAKRYVPEVIRFTSLALRAAKTKALQKSHISNLYAMTDLWASQPAFIEIFTPTVLPALQSLSSSESRRAVTHLNVLLSQSKQRRKPLELHHHRPLAIKTFVPKFEAEFDPYKHYDPDADRAESTRLHKEYKRERKGALRELRKDANFLSREKLREKKERDRAYEEKYKKLVASIQGEEGREANEYEKEKTARKKARKS